MESLLRNRSILSIDCFRSIQGTKQTKEKLANTFSRGVFFFLCLLSNPAMSGSVGCAPAGHSSAFGSAGMSMFRWLEVLEKEFDKAFVDVDMLLGEIDPDQVDITYEGRQKMTSLSSCFAQLCHKMQTVFQLNHKLEVSNSSSHSLFFHKSPLLISSYFVLCFHTFQ